jgi:aurora kinase
MNRFAKFFKKSSNENTKGEVLVKSKTTNDLQQLADTSVRKPNTTQNYNKVSEDVIEFKNYCRQNSEFSITIDQSVRAHCSFRSDIFTFLKTLDHVVIGEHISGIPFKTAPKALYEFQVIKKLATQTYCRVYKALHVESNIIVVLKIYNRFPNYLLYSIEREIEIQLSLNHKNVVKLYSSFIQHDMIVLVQEYARNQDLYIYQVKRGKLCEEECQQFARDILEGIEYIHSKCIAHRDIKPHNLFIDENLTIKLGDFGSCIDMSKENAVSCVGTTEFLAPEVQQCPLKHHVTDNRDREDLYYTSKCDIWSFGITLYQLLTGITPYQPIVYPSFLSHDAIEFLKLVIKNNPEKRLNANDLLNHKWLHND